MGILGIAKGGGYEPSILEIIIFALIFGLILGAISAIFGRSFWRFGSKRKTSGFQEQMNQNNNDITKNDSDQQDSIIPE